MNKKSVKERYSVRDGNPSREERIKALFDNKIFKVNSTFHKLDRFHRMTFSKTGNVSSFHPYQSAYDYSKVLDDYDHNGEPKKIQIIE